jgi:hypothetical protein
MRTSEKNSYMLDFVLLTGFENLNGFFTHAAELADVIYSICHSKCFTKYPAVMNRMQTETGAQGDG